MSRAGQHDQLEVSLRTCAPGPSRGTSFLMPLPGSQLNGTLSKRGRHSEGRPTKKTPEIIERIAEAINFGLTNEEVCELVGIEAHTLVNWYKDSEFFSATKRAAATRLVKRLKRIERGEPGWQGTAWIVERLMSNRHSPPEVQISLSNGAQEHRGAIKLTISAEEA
jgi:hypothetical protein